MNDTFLTPAHIHPSIDVLGNSQNFNFLEPFAFFALNNNFQPKDLISSITNFDFSNSKYCGFRFKHSSDIADNLGSFSFNYFLNKDSIGVPIFTANKDCVLFNAFARGKEPLVNNDFTTKYYVDSLIDGLPDLITLQGDVVGSGLLNQPINTIFQKTLNQIAPPTADLSLNNFKIANLANPVNSKDAVNLSFLQSYVGSHAGTVTSITAGSGLSGGTITSSGTISIADVGIIAGDYAYPTLLNINSKGQVIGASSGLQPFTSIIAGTGMSISTGGGSAFVNMANTSVVSGWYTFPSQFYVNQQGQLTNVTSGGSLPINRLAGYPSSSSYFLRGDGNWATPTFSGTIDINNNTTGQLSISRLSGYPSSSSYYLRGDGSWATPSPSITLPLLLYTADNLVEYGTENPYNSARIAIYNSNPSAVVTSFDAINQNNNYGTQFGYNNSTNEGYVWCDSPSALKFGTNGIKRMEILADGSINNYNLASFLCGSDAPCAKFYGTDNTFYHQMHIRPYTGYLASMGKYTRNGWTSFCLDCYSNNSGGSAIVMNGWFIQFIQNFGNLGIIFSDSDYETSTSYQSYIGSNGQLYVSSSKEKKYSIRAKVKKDYLERLNKLNVHSYALKCRLDGKEKQEDKERKYFKNKQLVVGLISEEVKELFDNCTDMYKTIAVDDNNKTDFEQMVGTYTPTTSEEDFIKAKESKRDIYAINYNALTCYIILAVQELTDKVKTLEKEIKKNN